MGTEIYWENCDFSEDHFVDHTCNILDDLEELNCKLFSSEKGKMAAEIMSHSSRNLSVFFQMRMATLAWVMLKDVWPLIMFKSHAWQAFAKISVKSTNVRFKIDSPILKTRGTTVTATAITAKTDRLPTPENVQNLYQNVTGNGLMIFMAMKLSDNIVSMSLVPLAKR